MIEVEGFLKKMTSVQDQILEFIDNDNIDETNCNNINQILDNLKINQNKNDFKSFLHLLSKISENHQRTFCVFPKIEQILLFYKKDIQNYFSNNEIFSIFKNNKRCILFLFQEKILSPNRHILSNFNKNQNKNYLAYCFQEIQDFYCAPNMNLYKVNYKIFSNMSDQKRKIGEDDSEVCQLIRNDSLDDFISYVNHHTIDYSTKIQPSVYETNSFLLKNGYTLIEYAAFSGSIKIFKYLYSIKADYNQTIWQYAIHGRNTEIIHLIENMDFSKEKIDFNAIYYESIKCFYKEISSYLEENYSEYIKIDFRKILKTYNFEYFTLDFFNEQDIFYELCHYDYTTIVEILLRTTNPIFQNKDKKEAISISAQKNNIDIINLLLQRKEVDINTKFLLADAIKKENEEIVQLLLSHDNIKINSIQAFSSGNNYIIKETNLISAIRQGNPEIVKMLLNYRKIDVNAVSIIKSRNDDTVKLMKPALYIAVEKGNESIIKMLLNRKDIKANKLFISEIFDENNDEIKREKKSVLTFAVEQNKTEIVKLLLNSGKIDVNYQSTTDNLKDEIFHKTFGIFILNTWVLPFLKLFLKNTFLAFIVFTIICYVWNITKNIFCLI